MFQRMIDFSDKVHYQWSGKFKAPSGEWMHMTRPLGDYELFIVTDGLLYIAEEEHKYTVKAGEYLLMAPTKKQYGYASSACSFYWMHFVPEEDGNRSGNQLIFPVQQEIPNMERLIILMNQLKDSEHRYHHRYTLDVMSLSILLELSNQLQLIEPGSVTSHNINLYHAVLEYISWYKLDRITVSELAEYFGYHEKYLSNLFKSIAGIPLKQYLLQEKMEYAKAELMDSRKTVAQIADSIGYTDSHNFSTAFKNQIGLSPREYRMNYRKSPENKK